MAKENFHIPIETLLHLPGETGIFWKDRQGHYLGCNDIAAEKTLLSSRLDVVGRSDFDLKTLRHDEASLIRSGDQTVLTTKKPHYFLYSATGSKASNIFVTMKSPLWNADKEIIGLYGMDFFVNDQDEKSYLALLAKSGIPIDDLKRLQGKIYTVKNSLLSKRQNDCLYYLVRGMTIKEIASKLTLSPKTVEHYLVAIKTKLKCRTKSELVAKALSIPAIRNKLDL